MGAADDATAPPNLGRLLLHAVLPAALLALACIQLMAMVGPHVPHHNVAEWIHRPHYNLTGVLHAPHNNVTGWLHAHHNLTEWLHMPHHQHVTDWIKAHNVTHWLHLAHPSVAHWLHAPGPNVAQWLPSGGAAPPPLIAPVLERGGPSNQVFQAKEVVFATRGCKGAVGLVLPPILPHYSQRKLEGPTPFSDFFTLEPGLLMDEAQLAALGRDHAPLKECTVYYSGAKYSSKRWLDNLVRASEPDPAMQRCQRFTDMFQKRTGGALCEALAFAPFNGTLCDLAARLRGGAGFALACDLEAEVSRQVWFNRTTMLSDVDYASWVTTAAALQLRRSTSIPTRTLALQLRVPDYALVREDLRDKVQKHFACLCLYRDCQHCHRKFHFYLRTKFLVAFLKKELKHSPLLAGVAAVHVMTNSPELAGEVQAGLQAAGYSVSTSSDNSLHALMHDYDIATQSTVFWTTVSSSIATNIIHARLADGKPVESVILWEKIWNATIQGRVDASILGNAKYGEEVKLPTRA